MIAERVSTHAKNCPASWAVVAGGQRLTYSKLHAQSLSVSCHLHRRGVRRGHMVTVCLPRTASLVSCLVGIVRCGAAYTVVEQREDLAENVRALRRITPDHVLTTTQLAPGLDDLSASSVAEALTANRDVMLPPVG